MSVNSITPDALLAQMRALARTAQGDEHSVELQRSGGTAPPAANDFGRLLSSALETVNTNQQAATRLSTSFERGEPGVELADVMVAIQKANVSFQAATQVRNRLVSAYQDIMNMPI